MATFADLMSLLMAFFVLLFSFSEMDRLKFKELAGSMRDAFGVQKEVKTREPPKGINIIAREFSAGRPEPTPLNVVRQFTTNDLSRHLAIAKTDRRGTASGGQPMDTGKVEKALEEEIEAGLVEVHGGAQRIVIRIKEHSSFASGSAVLRPRFVPILSKISRVLGEVEGLIEVAGHTDDVPIHNAEFSSNWELSTARATTVLHALLADQVLDATRFSVRGHGETRPLASNDSDEGRSRNRRVEVVLIQGTDIQRENKVEALDESANR